jgi:predicted NAD/FAD-binding protein
MQHSIDQFVFPCLSLPPLEQTISFSIMNTHRVAIVGAGAAGLSAAYALSKHPDKFTVTVFEKEPVAGGMASSMDVDPAQFGASYINDGVQGCSPAFANTLRIFRELGYPPEKVDMQYASHTTSHVFPFFYHISSFYPTFTLPESVLVKAKIFGPTSFPLRLQSASPMTSENLGAS